MQAVEAYAADQTDQDAKQVWDIKMDAKRFLAQYEKAEKRASVIQNELNELRDRRDGLQGFQVEERVQTSHKPDKIGELIARIADLEADLMDAKAEAIEIMLEVEAVINRVPDPLYQLLLQDRYIRLHKWSEIAEALHYTPRGIYAVHRRALTEVNKLI